jgi:hypothetical protein
MGHHRRRRLNPAACNACQKRAQPPGKEVLSASDQDFSSVFHPSIQLATPRNKPQESALSMFYGEFLFLATRANFQSEVGGKRVICILRD